MGEDYGVARHSRSAKTRRKKTGRRRQQEVAATNFGKRQEPRRQWPYGMVPIVIHSHVHPNCGQLQRPSYAGVIGYSQR